MKSDNMSVDVIASDLDGTLIPLPNAQDNLVALRELKSAVEQCGARWVFVTGRHLSSVEEVINAEQLPCPDWIIGDVGTTIYQRSPEGFYQRDEDYWAHLKAKTVGLTPENARAIFADLHRLELQESEKQGDFKLSYYCRPDELDDWVRLMNQRLCDAGSPLAIVGSTDPFGGRGLIDVLPQGVSKAYALDWWVRIHQGDRCRILFAGDSGNDLAAFEAGYRAVVVGNAPRDLARKVYGAYAQMGWTSRPYLAHQRGTSGVLEGLRWFSGLRR
jgi:HAD superfamily hydrolase (TIGR01484 family)